MIIVSPILPAAATDVADSSEGQKMAQGDLWQPRYQKPEITGDSEEDFFPVFKTECNKLGFNPPAPKHNGSRK